MDSMDSVLTVACEEDASAVFPVSQRPDSMVTIGDNITIAKIGDGSELKIGHDAYEQIKYNHGQFTASEKAGCDIQVKSDLVKKCARVPKAGVLEWMAVNSVFREMVEPLDEKGRQFLADNLVTAAFEIEGAEKLDQVIISRGERTIRVVLLLNQEVDDNSFRFIMVSHTEIAQCRPGLEWGEKWHENKANQKMLSDWCTYRMLHKLGNEGIAQLTDFVKQKPIDDEVRSAQGPKVQAPVVTTTTGGGSSSSGMSVTGLVPASTGPSSSTSHGSSSMFAVKAPGRKSKSLGLSLPDSRSSKTPLTAR